MSDIEDRSSTRLWSVYIVRCADGTLYTGVTNDVAGRIARHNAGLGARYTRSRLPVEVVYVENAAARSDAQRREHQIKRLCRADKKRLIASAGSTERAASAAYPPTAAAAAPAGTESAEAGARAASGTVPGSK